MRDFLNEHRALFLKHARHYVRGHAEKIAAEDVARELELELVQLEKTKGLVASSIASPDSFLRPLVKHAAGRAKRRRKLIEQVAAGDDLQAVSDDLAALDGDLPEVTPGVTEEALAARRTLDAVKAKLSARDALFFALLIEDDFTVDEVARVLSTRADEVEQAHARILVAAGAAGVSEKLPAGRPSLVDATEQA